MEVPINKSLTALVLFVVNFSRRPSELNSDLPTRNSDGLLSLGTCNIFIFLITCAKAALHSYTTWTLTSSLV